MSNASRAFHLIVTKLENLVRIPAAKQVSLSHPYRILANGFPIPAAFLPFQPHSRKTESIGFEKSFHQLNFYVNILYLTLLFQLLNELINQTRALGYIIESKHLPNHGCRDISIDFERIFVHL